MKKPLTNLLARSITTRTKAKTTTRGFCSNTITNSENKEKIIASVVFERLPVIVPKMDPNVYAFKEFSFRWNQQFRKQFPDEVLESADSRGKGDFQVEYEPAPRITEADKTNDRKSLQRAYDRRLFLLLYGYTYGAPDGKPVWHFPERVYRQEKTLRKCAEYALKSVIGDASLAHFVGNAPIAHVVTQPRDIVESVSSIKRFFFKSQVIATNKYKVQKCEDFEWVTKDELIEHFPKQAEFLNKMLIS